MNYRYGSSKCNVFLVLPLQNTSGVTVQKSTLFKMKKSKNLFFLLVGLGSLAQIWAVHSGGMNYHCGIEIHIMTKSGLRSSFKPCEYQLEGQFRNSEAQVQIFTLPGS